MPFSKWPHNTSASAADPGSVQCVGVWQMQHLSNLCTDTLAEMENKLWSW